MEMADLVIMAAAVGIVAIVIRSQIEKFSMKKRGGDGENHRGNWRGNSRGNSAGAGANSCENSRAGGANSNLDGAGGENSRAHPAANPAAKNAGANPAGRDYAGFCAAIDAELDALREVCAGDSRKLAKLAAFSKELVFIQTMGADVGSARWEEKLFKFLSRVDDFVLAELPPAQAQGYLDEMKLRLAAAYRAA